MAKKVVVLALFVVFLVASATSASDLSVNAQRLDGGIFVISGTTTVAASQDIAWDTVTDFENLPRFIPVFTSSKAGAISNETLRLAQTMRTSFKMLCIRWTASVKAVYNVRMERTPLRSVVSFQSIEGDLKSIRGSYTIESSGDAVKVGLHIIAVPGPLASIVVDAHMIARLVEAQLTSLTQEIERRENLNRQNLELASSTPVMSSLQ